MKEWKNLAVSLLTSDQSLFLIRFPHVKGNPAGDRALPLGGGEPPDGRCSAGQERVGSQRPRKSDVRATKGKRENDILEERKIKERLRDTKT